MQENESRQIAVEANKPEVIRGQLRDYLVKEPSNMKREALADVVDWMKREQDRESMLTSVRHSEGNLETKNSFESQLRVKEVCCGILDHEMNRKRLDPQTGQMYGEAFDKIADISSRLSYGYELSDHEGKTYTQSMAKINAYHDLLDIHKSPPSPEA